MSNTRKLRQHGGDPERERRHLAWLNLGDNIRLLTERSQRAYALDGRGYWFASLATAPDLTPVIYIPQGKIMELPAGESRDIIARMVATYDPAAQFVIVIMEEGQMSAYKARAVHLDPSLN